MKLDQAIGRYSSSGWTYSAQNLEHPKATTQGIRTQWTKLNHSSLKEKVRRLHGLQDTTFVMSDNNGYKLPVAKTLGKLVATFNSTMKNNLCLLYAMPSQL